jgi:RNA polymerase sigma-70 factor (ECF subfamily)
MRLGNCAAKIFRRRAYGGSRRHDQEAWALTHCRKPASEQINFSSPEPFQSFAIQGNEGCHAMPEQLKSKPLSDADDATLVRLALAREAEAFRVIMTRNNQRLYRMARAILHNDSEAEDALQDAYMHAFARLDCFRGECALATWLSRIVINEALGRLRKKRREAEKRFTTEQAVPDAQIIRFPVATSADDPERNMAQRQILELIERTMDGLPEKFRVVLMARTIEGLNVEETAELLGIKPETVKTRLYRARRLLHEKIDEQIGPVMLNAYPFAGRRCERVTEAVLSRLALETQG